LPPNFKLGELRARDITLIWWLSIRPVVAGVDSEEAMREAIDFAEHDDANAGDDPLYRFLFDRWFTQPNIESVYIEATGSTVSQLDD